MSHHLVLLKSLTSHQQSLIKSHLVDIDNRFNEILPSFTPLYSELSPGHRIIDNFSDHFILTYITSRKTINLMLINLTIWSLSHQIPFLPPL